MIIRVSGKAGHGKDTVCDRMIKALKRKGKKANRFAFSDELKVFTDNVYQDLKLFFMDDYDQFQHINNSLKEDPEGMKFRRSWWLSVGKNAKKSFGKQIWIEAVFRKPFVQQCLQSYDNFAIIPDLRFMNELEYCQHKIGDSVKMMRVWRPGSHPIAGYLGTSQQLVMDKSEVDLDTVPKFGWDYYVENNGDLASLQRKVRDIVNSIVE